MKYMPVRPPEYCDFCRKPLEGIFTHGKTVYGTLAVMCRRCAPKHGMPKGEQYILQIEDGRWLKT